jgi:hypothetical protein
MSLDNYKLDIEEKINIEQLSNKITLLEQENQELKKEMNAIKKHIVNLHFQLLNTDVDCAYEHLTIGK